MECALASLHALIACFNWSNLYIDGGLSYQDVGVTVVQQHWVENYIYISDFAPAHTSRYSESARSPAENPYGRIALGYQIDFRHVSWSIEIQHISSLATDRDRGVNSVQLRARWFPFR
jgi:hypothetical protein